MKHFYTKILISAIFIFLCLCICVKLVFFPVTIHFSRNDAYDTASWLSKHNITISKDIIDTTTHEVYEAELTSIAADKDKTASLILGSDMKKSAADTYIGDNGTLVFSLMNFEMNLSEEYIKEHSDSTDRYNAPKKAESFVKECGINLNGTSITAHRTDNGYSVAIVKTIDSLPVFNDLITVTMNEDGIIKTDGIWYFDSGAPKTKKRAKTAIDALGEYLRTANGAEKEITTLELGYMLEDTSSETTKILPVWRIIDSEGIVSVTKA